MAELTPENRIVDIPDLNGFQIGEHVVVDASADNDRFEGVIIGIELRRLYGSNRLVPSITLLHDSYITDEFKPSDCRKVSPSPKVHVGVTFVAECLRNYAEILRSGRIDNAGHYLPEDIEEAAERMEARL